MRFKNIVGKIRGDKQSPKELNFPCLTINNQREWLILTVFVESITGSIDSLIVIDCQQIAIFTVQLFDVERVNSIVSGFPAAHSSHPRRYSVLSRRLNGAEDNATVATFYHPR